uniref:Uncharacterized protein n=1 Tax=Schistosoma curassoni TaxID=6186 RepID=A0A183KEZ6_9TREM
MKADFKKCIFIPVLKYNANPYHLYDHIHKFRRVMNMVFLHDKQSNYNN